MVPYTVATDMDAPHPDSGEEWFHTNTQLFSVLDAHNRFKNYINAGSVPAAASRSNSENGTTFVASRPFGRE